MSRLYLARHGNTAAVGRRLVGRMPGIPLDAQGEREVRELALRLSSVRFDAIYASPLERAQATARAVAARQALEVEIRPALTDVEFGEWAGLEYEALAGVHAFEAWNTFRAGSRPPGGEHAIEVQARMVGELELLRERHSSGCVLVVGHGDPIKLAVGHYLGIPIDLQSRIEIATASVTVLTLESWGARLELLNDTGRLRPER